jgi:hypothetical protein
MRDRFDYTLRWFIEAAFSDRRDAGPLADGIAQEGLLGGEG